MANSKEYHFTFSKKEKLTSKIEIEALFSDAKSFRLHPFKILYSSEISQLGFPKVLISVSKKHFKNATDRNVLKRRIRECYRLNKRIIIQNSKIIPESIGIIYASDKIIPFKLMEEKLILALNRLYKQQLNLHNHEKSI